MTFRALDEMAGSLNKGNYLSTTDIRRKYDVTLNINLTTSTVFIGTSRDIRNDLIKAVADVIRDNTKSQTDAALSVAIMLHETSNEMCKSHLSTILRYVFQGKV